MDLGGLQWTEKASGHGGQFFDHHVRKPLYNKGFLAEGQGFEPWVRGYLTMVFKTISLGHSDSPPGWVGAIPSECHMRQRIAPQMVLDGKVPGSPLCWAAAG